MGQSRAEIEAHIEDKRHELTGNLKELETRVKSAADVRHQFDRRPLAFTGLAFGAGIVLAALLRRGLRV